MNMSIRPPVLMHQTTSWNSSVLSLFHVTKSRLLLYLWRYLMPVLWIWRVLLSFFLQKLHEIEDILRDADFLMLHVENRDLAKTGEYLTRCILKLDFISTASDDVRNKRREAVKHLQMYLGRIEEVSLMQWVSCG